MSEQTANAALVVTNEQGLHLRPADLLSKAAAKFDASVEIIHGADRVDAKSILSLLALAAVKGTTLTFEAKGPDAKAAIVAITELFDSDFAGPETADQPQT